MIFNQNLFCSLSVAISKLVLHIAEEVTSVAPPLGLGLRSEFSWSVAKFLLYNFVSITSLFHSLCSVFLYLNTSRGDFLFVSIFSFSSLMMISLVTFVVGVFLVLYLPTFSKLSPRVAWPQKSSKLIATTITTITSLITGSDNWTLTLCQQCC